MKIVLALLHFVSHPFRLLGAQLDRLLASPVGGIVLFKMMAGLLAVWWVYVPLHEFLHAGFCLLAGGDVKELQISFFYGGELWARLLPFVRAGGEYAGRLSSFDTHGSDLLYAGVILAPYSLCPLGFLWMSWASVRRRPFQFGASLVPAFSPLLSLTGDFFELASLGLFQIWPSSPLERALIRDDFFVLVDLLRNSPATTTWDWAFAGTALLASLLLALAWLGLTCLSGGRGEPASGKGSRVWESGMLAPGGKRASPWAEEAGKPSEEVTEQPKQS